MGMLLLFREEGAPSFGIRTRYWGEAERPLSVQSGGPCEDRSNERDAPKPVIRVKG